jgi:hypothetical protein
VLGSLIAVALLGIVARIGINRAWFNHGWFNRGWLDRARMSLNGSGLRRSRATVIPARARATVGKAMPANGRRRRKRRRKAATHA